MRSIGVALVFACGGCDLLFGIGTFTHDPPPGTHWLDGYAHRKRIDLVPRGLTETLIDYPVAIVIEADPDLAAMAPRTDFALTAADGTTLLASELESYKQDGSLALWGRLPMFTGVMPIYLYYGGPAASEQRGAAWSDSYAAVWHMAGEDAAMATDSTSHRLDVSQVVTSHQALFAYGAVGVGRLFDGMDDYFGRMDDGTSALDVGTGALTWTALLWSVAGPIPNTYNGLMYKGGASGNDPGFDVELMDQSWRIDIADGVSTDAVGAYFQYNGIADLQQRWVHLAAVVDRGRQFLRVFVDGHEVISMAAPQPIVGIQSLSGTSPLLIGGIDPTRCFNGTIDEMRVYAGALSDRWIEIEADNLTHPKQFINVGPAESPP